MRARMPAEMRRLPRSARETVTLETPQRLAIVSSVGVTIEWEHELSSSASLLVKQRLVLRRVLLGGGGPYFAPGPDEVGGGASRGERGAGGGVQRSRDALSRGFGMLDF